MFWYDSVMKFPADLNPRCETIQLPYGTPMYKVTLNFNGQDHEYQATEMSDFAALNILLQAMADGYGDVWTPIEVVQEIIEELNE